MILFHLYIILKSHIGAGKEKDARIFVIFLVQYILLSGYMLGMPKKKQEEDWEVEFHLNHYITQVLQLIH